MKKETFILIALIIFSFAFGIYIGTENQKKETLNRAKSYGETDFYSYEQVEFIILSNN
jgi:hypothetical protein